MISVILKTFRLVFVLSLLFSSRIAFSGVSSVGHGGGLGELQFIYYFNNIHRIIDLCQKSEACAVSSQQTKTWTLLKQKSSAESEQINIHFVPEQSTGPWNWSDNKLTISQKWLYQNDHLKSDGEIMSFALAIQLSHYLQLDFETMYLDSYQSLSRLNFYNRSTKSSSGNFIFHSIHFSNEINSLNLFALEDPLNSILLNELLLFKAPLLDISSLQFYDLQIIENSMKIIVFGTISGINDGSVFNRRPIRIESPLNSNGTIQDAQIKIFFLLE